VLEVLAGASPAQAAAKAGLCPADVTDAVDVFHAAGHAALLKRASGIGWFAVLIQPTAWDTAEQAIASHLAPFLRQAQSDGTLGTWWFLRKHPCWRVRLQPGPTTTHGDLEVLVGVVLNNLTAAGVLDRWRVAIYEPEIFAFGGPAGMEIAHALFHLDSSNILNGLGHREMSALGRRELSIMLCGSMFRAAGQDWYEQGDIWHRVAQLRPLPTGIPTDRLPDLADDLRRLLTLDSGRLLDNGGALGAAAPWAAGFHDAGRGLADAAGTLRRGTRDVLAHHVIFHWNRLGLSATTQAILARAARDAVMCPSRTADGR
jgi:thiopeptide-type bacteriocin biosynthesis protein